MKTTQKIFTLLFLIIISPNTAIAQYLGHNPINDSLVSKWTPESKSQYLGAYNFGSSDGESTLYVFGSKEKLIVQIKNSVWSSDTNGWVSNTVNLSNVKIDDKGEFYSDQYKGEFVIYNGREKKMECLKIYDPWGYSTKKKGEYELGYKCVPFIFSLFHPGKYSIASTQILNPKDLRKMTTNELKIMRNEIFARYGYMFKKDGKMDKYFRRQVWGGHTHMKSRKWYRPQHSNVNKFLSEVEKKNIKLIRAEEKRKREN